MALVLWHWPSATMPMMLAWSRYAVLYIDHSAIINGIVGRGCWGRNLWRRTASCQLVTRQTMLLRNSGSWNDFFLFTGTSHMLKMETCLCYSLTLICAIFILSGFLISFTKILCLVVVPDLLCLECELVSVIDVLDFNLVLILCQAYLSILTFCSGIFSGLVLPRSSPSAYLIDLLVSDIVKILFRMWILISHCVDGTVLIRAISLRSGRDMVWPLIVHYLHGWWHVRGMSAMFSRYHDITHSLR